MWHLQPTRLTARCFAEGCSYESRDTPVAIAQVDLRTDGSAFVHATMSREGGAITPAMWRGLARQLRAMGVTVMEWEHKGAHLRVELSRA